MAGDKENNRGSRPVGSTARPFPSCGALSVAAPLLGYVALEVILPCFEGGRHWSWRLFLDGGPTWLQGLAYTITGFAGLVGFALGCLALWRSENRALAALGLVLNAPFILLLVLGLAELLPELSELPGRLKGKGTPLPGPANPPGD